VDRAHAEATVSAARDDILAAVRRAVVGDPAADHAACDRRLAHPSANTVPARGRGTAAELRARFIAEAEAAAATVARVADRAAVPAVAAAWLAANGLPTKAGVAPALETLPWSRTPELDVGFGRAEADTPVSVSAAVAGIAETGTLVLLSGPRTPTTLNYLPDVHLVVLDARRIVGAYEDAWAMLRAAGGAAGFMPRAVNWITGPSRSADIELVLLLGVHGPRRLHILLVDGEAA